MTDAEIIRTIAEKVMGWTLMGSFPLGDGGETSQFRLPSGATRWLNYPLDGDVDRFDPLASISDAFMVVEKMRERIPYQTRTQAFSFQLCQTGIPGKWFCSFVTNPGDWSTQARADDADSPARAICLAAIAAIAETKDGNR